MQIVVPNFEEIFPEEKKETALFYLLKIPKELLLKSVGFLNTYPLPNYYNFFSKRNLTIDIAIRIELFKRGLDIQVEIITPYSYLRLSELILSNIEKFGEGDKDSDSELNLFKAFLVLNSRLGEYNHEFLTNPSVESLIDFYTLQEFQLSEISIYHNKDGHRDFIKLIYATIYKVENLLKFLSFKNLDIIKTAYIESFGTKNENEYLYNMKYLFVTLFMAKFNNQYIFTNQKLSSLDFIKNITATQIKEDEDFTELKKTPIYFIDETTFSVVNFHFAVDLFYRSTKFRLKEIFEKNKIKGDFFKFYTTEFSEKFLMKNLLDYIFSKKYYIKKTVFKTEENNEPDYYVNYNNTLFVFENKDVLIAKNIKAAKNIQTLENFLKERFLQSDKGVGIKQLVNTIEFVRDNNFKFDNTINYNRKIEIFPILLVHDRIFESPGINYKLNKWFSEELNSRNIISTNKFKIHPLTLIDIDTLILWKEDIKDNFNQFKRLLVDHTKQLNEELKNHHKNPNYFEKYIQRIILPISFRKTPFQFNPKEHLKQFSDLLQSQN